MVDDCEISEFPPHPHLTWPRTWRRRAPPGTPRLFCCSTASCLTSPSSYQFWNHVILDLIQTEAHTQTNRTGGWRWWGGTLAMATCLCLPVTPPPAPHRLCHYTYYLPSCWAIDNFYIYHISLSKNHFYFSINCNLKFCGRPLHDKEMDKVNITWKKSIYITFLSLWEQCKKQLAPIFSYTFHI